ncbi:MAG: BhlA/UviB family holin-like peptide [Sarcina sp.]
MQQYIFEFLAAQGIFTVLFCYLLFYVLKENNRREIRYQEFIFKISEKHIGLNEEIETFKKTL